MAGAVHALADVPAHAILRLDLGRHRDAVLALGLEATLFPGEAVLLSGGGDAGDLARLLLRMLRLLHRVTRAGLAALVAALHAHLVDAEGGLAAVAGAMDAHADRLLHPLDAIGRRRRRPLVRLERQTVLLEERASLLLLERGPVRDALLELFGLGLVADLGLLGLGLFLGLADLGFLLRNGFDRLTLGRPGGGGGGRAMKRRRAGGETSSDLKRCLSRAWKGRKTYPPDGVSGAEASPELERRLVLSRFNADLARVMNLVKLWRLSPSPAPPPPPPPPPPLAAVELMAAAIFTRNLC